MDDALNNELTVWNPDKWAYVPMKPDSIEPTTLSMIPQNYGDKLLDIMDMLQDKVDEPEFWKVDGVFLDRLVTLITELNDQKGFERLSQHLPLQN